MSSVSKKIEKIEKLLNELKLAVENKSEKKIVNRKPKDKPASITECKTKSEVKKFTVKELKQFVKESGIDIKKLSEKHKDDLVKVVWKKLKSDSSSEESDSDSSSESSSDSGEESS
jgi:hypothetical protein